MKELSPDIIDLQSPTSTVTSTPVILKATYLHGAWIYDIPAESQHDSWKKVLIWSKSPPDVSNGVWNDRNFVTPQCEPLRSAKHRAVRCTATIHAKTNGNYYFRWYLNHPNNSELSYSEPTPVGSYTLAIPSPPLPTMGSN
jgi:hypothetical protein